jgi:hypothetical protein
METADTDFLIQFEDNYNDETLAAFQETENIASGKIKPKTYDNLSVAIKDLDSDEKFFPVALFDTPPVLE